MPGTEDFEVAAQKNSLHDSQSKTLCVKALRPNYQMQFMETLGTLVKRLKCIDESESYLGLKHLYGRAAPGQRIVEATPGYSGLATTLGGKEVTTP